MNLRPIDYLRQTASETLEIQKAFHEEYGEKLVRAAAMIGECFRNGGKVLICGNGGSAADAQHMAAELVGRMLVERRPLPAIALTTDSSNLTAIGNDFGYDVVFSKQVEALGQKGDVLIAISTSGNSGNVMKAVEAARKIGVSVIGLSGNTGGALAKEADLSLNVSKGKNSSRIQESHIFAVHSMVDLLDRFFLSEQN